MWPFKKKEAVDFNEWAKAQPLPFCGNKKTHYNWAEGEGQKQRVSCPACSSKVRKAKEEADLNLQAERVALKVVELLKEAD